MHLLKLPAMAIVGYIASFFIGVSLGLIGGGGSILTVPVLVYFFGVSPHVATSYSLVIVGITSLAGSVSGIHNKLVHFKTAALFGVPSVFTVFVIRKMLLPGIPPQINIFNYQLSFGVVTMVLFALLMIAASFSMIGKQPAAAHKMRLLRKKNLVLLGVGIGLITGFLGAGGGFLLIPALVLLVNMPMKQAVATSLFIIALNSAVGFLADTGHMNINYRFLGTITCIAIGGVIVGGLLNKKVDAGNLRTGFGWFVLVLGCLILVKELFVPA